MRVHGDIKIERRTYQEKIDTQAAKEMLRADFYELCGYCGKNGRRLRQRFHVDHFVPKSVDKDRISDYANFVLSCPKCNLRKSNQWPTGDKRISHTNEIGFVDPASDEFDKHLHRNQKGHIEGLTPLGEQMCRLLNFHLRRTELFWKVNKLCEQRDCLKEKVRAEGLDHEEAARFTALSMVLDDILDALYDEGE